MRAFLRNTRETMSSKQKNKNLSAEKEYGSRFCGYQHKEEQHLDSNPSLTRIQKNKKLMRSLSEHDFSDIDLFYVTQNYPDFFQEDALDEAQKQLDRKQTSLESLAVQSKRTRGKKTSKQKEGSDGEKKDFDTNVVLQAFDMVS